MLASAPKRALRAVAEDVRAFGRQMRAAFGLRRTRPGLYAYPLEDDNGSRRLHLRAHNDGSGVLFVDVSDVVHLTPLATDIARMVLDGMTQDQVRTLLRSWYPDAPEADLRRDVAALDTIITSLKRPGQGCPTCLPELERVPLFSRRPQAPYKADLALTYRCNNDCAHCYNEPGRKGLPSLDARGWRRVLRRLADIGVPHIIFTGGEPTLCEHLPALVEHASGLGQVAGLNTNGRLLADQAFAERLAAAGLDHVQITLASHLPKLHNAVVRAPAYDETTQGVRSALAAGLHTITNTTLTHLNRDHALAIVEFVRDLGVTTFAMNGMICAGGGRHNPSALTERELAPLLDEVRERAGDLGMHFLWYTPTEYCRLSPLALGLGPKSCNAAEYSICVEPNGDVLPCQSYYQPTGNLLRDDWDDIWDSPLFRSLRLRREEPQAAGLPERCFECEDLTVCGGGCPLQRAERSEEALPHAT
ncbi:MAG: radical SAM protein [Armatimonadota bacterium]